MTISVKKSVAVISAIVLTASACAGINIINNLNVANPLNITVSAAETMRDISSQELVEDMGLGWNLGNDLDCYGTWVSGLDTEGCWGNPKITRDVIKKVKETGFKTVRIPITWSKHFDENGVIDEAWLARVQEVVDWCIDEGLYVVVNMHHDGNGESDIDWIRNAQNDYASTSAKYTKIWSQIADTFKDYSDYLLFESMNEVEFKDVSKSVAYETLNKLNQDFVDTIRESGGNNSQRHLIIAGYITDIAQTCDTRYQMPEDPADKCIVSVHYYTPSPFCVAGAGVDWCTPQSTWGTDADYAEMDTNFKKMYTNFVSKGVPVFIGEYGVLTEAKNGKESESIVRYLKAVSETAVKYGMCPVLWDGSVGSDMNFIDRNSIAFNDANIEAVYKDAAERIESGELKKEDISVDSGYKEVEVSLTNSSTVDISQYDKAPIGAKIYLSCSTDWDSYGGGAVHYDNGTADWVFQEYGFNSVYDTIEMQFNDDVMASIKNGTAKQLDFFIWWTALDNEADEDSGHQSELSFKDNKVVLLFENDSQPAETTETTETTLPEDTTTTTEETTTTVTEITTTEADTTTTEETTVTSEVPVETTTTTAVISDVTTEGTSTAGSEITAKLLGDVTDDGEIDIRDITLLNQFTVKSKELTPQQYANADVVKDGVVEIKDLGQLKKFIIKVISSFE